jgi:hypothetical protein
MSGWQQVGVGALASLLSAIVAVYLTNRHSRLLAQRSGAFKRAKIRFVLLRQTVTAHNPPLAWCFRHPGPEEQAAVYSLPFDLTNVGDARCDDLVVTLTGPAECFGNPEGALLSTTPGVFEGLATRSQNDLGKLTLVAYRIDKVGANSSVSIRDLVILRPSINLSHTVHATTKDNVGVTAHLRYTLAYLFRWSVLIPDERSIHFRTPVYCIAAPTNGASAKEFVDTVLSEKIQSHLSSAGRWERIRYRFLGKGIMRKVVFVDFGRPEIVSMKGQKQKNKKKPQTPPQITVYRFDQGAEKPMVETLDCLIPRFMEWWS